uniref:Uncharacterized protein n=1 Tax=Anguilla anguilla TaxID=7936 RepID=A0A0E9VRM2_ANGAN
MIYKYIFKKLKEDCQKPEDGTVCWQRQPNRPFKKIVQGINQCRKIF